MLADDVAMPAPNRDALDDALVKDYANLKMQSEWKESHMFAVQVVAKRLKGKIAPDWEKFLLEVLNAQEAPADVQDVESVLFDVLGCEVMYVDAKTGKLQFFTIRTLLECLAGEQKDPVSMMLKVAPGRADDLMRIKEVGVVKKIMDNPDLHRQFNKQYSLKLPPLIKSEKANPRQNASGQWKWMR